MAKIHENYIMKLFINNTIVLTGSELSNKICNEFPNCTPENSRKIIQNAVKKNIISSSKPMTFGKNQYAYYSIFHELSNSDIKELLKQNNKSISRVVERLEQNGGIISYPEIFKISGCIVGKNKTKVYTINEVVSILENMDLVRKESNYGVKYLINIKITTSEAIQLMEQHNEKIKLDCTFIPSFLYWMQKHNLIDNNTMIYRNKINLGQGVNHNNLFWDAYAYTSTTGYSEYISIDEKKDEDKKTLIVIDFKISGAYDSLDLAGFYERIQIHRNSVQDKKNKRKVLPIIVSTEMDSYTEASLKKLKILSFNLGTVFGERIFEIINNLKELSNIKLSAKPNEYIENILKILKESGQDVNLGNLKGDLFESLMYPAIQKIVGFALIEPSFKYKTFEYDYITTTHNEIIVFELKGYNSDKYINLGEFDKDKQKPQKYTVKWFFNYTFKILKEEFLNKNKNNKKISACYITTAKFSHEAIEKLNELSKGGNKPKNINLYYDGKELIQLLEKYDCKNEIKLIKRYYFNDERENKDKNI